MSQRIEGLTELGAELPCFEGFVHQRRERVRLVAIAWEAIWMSPHHLQRYANKRNIAPRVVRFHLPPVGAHLDMRNGVLQANGRAVQVAGLHRPQAGLGHEIDDAARFIVEAAKKAIGQDLPADEVRVEGHTLLVLTTGNPCLSEDGGEAVLFDIVDGGEHPGDMTDDLVGRIDFDLATHDAVLQMLPE
jgi:hypothetical protein